MRKGLLLFLSVIVTATSQSTLAGAGDSFRRGVDAYHAGEFAGAAREFRAAAASPGTGTLLNLGLSEWRRGRAGAAVLAWEQAGWLNPFDARPRDNLRYARQLTGLEAPEWTWYERASAWLPPNAWAWLVGASLWLAIGLAVLPGVLRWRKAAWTQALAAVCLAVFLASLPGYCGMMTRTQIGFVLQKNTPLRLTPSAEGESVARLAAGEPGRVTRARGNYFLVRTARGQGWVERAQFGLVCPH